MAKKRSNYTIKLDKTGKLQGIITDGDIKRFILRNQGVTEKDTIQFNSNFFYMDAGKKLSDLLKLEIFRSELGCVPLRSENGEFDSAVTVKSIWGK